MYRILLTATLRLILPWCVAVGLIAGTAAEETDPLPRRYGGYPLSFWKPRLPDFDPQTPRAQELVPGLIEIVADDGLDDVLRRHAASALGRLGEPARAAVPKLVEIVRSDTADPPRAALWAAKALAQLGPHARDATPELALVLHAADRPAALRTMCLEALSQIGGAHPDAPAAVAKLLSPAGPDVRTSADAELRELAVEALGAMRGDAAVAAPLLVRILQSPDQTETMRRRCVTALGQAGSSAEIATAPLAEALLYDESEAIRDAAADALAAIGPPARPALLQLAAAQDPGVRWRVAKALAVGGESPAIDAAVTALLKDAREEVRLAAAQTSWRRTKLADPLLPVTLGLLSSDDRPTRMAAIKLLASFGPQARPALAPLQTLLHHERDDVRRAAEQAIRKISPQER